APANHLSRLPRSSRRMLRRPCRSTSDPLPSTCLRRPAGWAALSTSPASQTSEFLSRRALPATAHQVVPASSGGLPIFELTQECAPYVARRSLRSSKASRPRFSRRWPQPCICLRRDRPRKHQAKAENESDTELLRCPG